MVHRALRPDSGTPLHDARSLLPPEKDVPEPPPAPYDSGSRMLITIGTEIRRTLTECSIALPYPVGVAPYPLTSFNAQVRMVDDSALILVNQGLHVLVQEIVNVMNISVQQCSFHEDGSVTLHDPTEEFRLKEAAAYRALASAVLTYVDTGIPWQAEPQWPDEDWRDRVAAAQEAAVLWFVIAHEVGHLLADHLSPGATRTDDKAWEREFEADQLAALMVLNHMESLDQVSGFQQAAGPFFFFAIDHLIRRVRNEVVGLPHGYNTGTHPPSDQRAAALRGMFVAAHGPSIMHVADSGLHFLSWRENEIVAQVRELCAAAGGS